MNDKALRHLQTAQGLAEEMAHHIALAIEIERVTVEEKASETGIRTPDPLASADCARESAALGEDRQQSGEVVNLFDW